MTTPLTAEERKRVAEAVQPAGGLRRRWVVRDNRPRLEWRYDEASEWRLDNGSGSSWSPEINPWQWQALVRKVADLIKDYDPWHVNTTNWINCQGRFIKAVAANDTNALESLLLELMEGV